MPARKWTDEQLIEAMKSATSWSDLARELGVAPTSTSSRKGLRTALERMNVDHSHFRGQRTWTDAQLEEAVLKEESWFNVMRALGITNNGKNRSSVHFHCERLGLDVESLAQQAHPKPDTQDSPFPDQAKQEHLRKAGPSFAAAWFTARGYNVSWPLEPTPYDLVVDSSQGLKRVQVKTTGDNQCGVARRLGSRYSGGTFSAPYNEGEFDYFFIVDGAHACYIIPLSQVLGKTSISLEKHAAFKVAGIWDAA